jgi:phosphomannomutase
LTRKYFGTDGIRGRVGEPPITPDFVMRLGNAAGRVLAGSNVAAGSVSGRAARNGSAAGASAGRAAGSSAADRSVGVIAAGGAGSRSPLTPRRR